jgi:hypothetical protein
VDRGEVFLVLRQVDLLGGGFRRRALLLQTADLGSHITQIQFRAIQEPTASRTSAVSGEKSNVFSSDNDDDVTRPDPSRDDTSLPAPRDLECTCSEYGGSVIT